MEGGSTVILGGMLLESASAESGTGSREGSGIRDIVCKKETEERRRKKRKIRNKKLRAEKKEAWYVAL